MRILSIIPNKYALNVLNNKNQVDYPKNQTLSLSAPLPADTVSFGRLARNAEPLRRLMAYDIPDMYSGKVVIDPKVLEDFYEKHVFSRNIKNIVKTIVKYENSLHTVEKQFFNIVKNMAKTNPYYKLEDVVRKIAPEHNSKLLEVQRPIFEEISELAQEMPPEQYKEFNNLMNVINQKLNRKPVQLPFSAKEFQYKLQRIADEVAQKNNPNERDIMRRIIALSKQMPEKSLDEFVALKDIKSKVKRNKKVKNQRNLIRKRAEILTDIEVNVSGTSLTNNQELIRLLSQTRSKIYNIPLVVPFNRKSFIYELRKITDTLDNTKLAHRLVQKAVKLPTSHENLSAFIMKCVEYSSDKIGYNMIDGSRGSIDHLIPYVKNGKDSLENYGISSAYYNSERAERSMVQQLKKYPKAYINCQKQVDRLIELCNNGTFKKVNLSKHYIINFVRRMYNLSPKEQRLELNIDKLK